MIDPFPFFFEPYYIDDHFDLPCRVGHKRPWTEDSTFLRDVFAANVHCEHCCGAGTEYVHFGALATLLLNLVVAGALHQAARRGREETISQLCSGLTWG